MEFLKINLHEKVQFRVIIVEVRPPRRGEMLRQMFSSLQRLRKQQTRANNTNLYVKKKVGAKTTIYLREENRQTSCSKQIEQVLIGLRN